MRKKITTTIFTVALATLLGSCQLDYAPTSSVSDASITDEDIDALLTGVYDGVQSSGFSFFAQDIAADNLKARTWSGLIQIDNNAITTDNSYMSGWWDSYFGDIALANNFLSIISKQGDTEANREKIAQARFIRAWSYYYIVTLWGGAPVLTAPTTELVPRNSEAEVWQQIKEDAEYALENAPDFSDKALVSKIAAKAFLARILLIGPTEIQDKAKAAQYAEDVIASGEFSLADDPAQIWQTKNSKEIILEWTASATDAIGLGWWLRSNLVNSVPDHGVGDLGRYELPVDTAVVSRFEPGDKRFKTTLRHLKSGSSETWDCIKYPNYDGSDAIPVLRIAEMYLISAEAQGYPAGVERLNELRKIRGVKPYTPGVDITADNFFEKIINERQLEFFAEGQRFYDLKRWFFSGEKGKQAVLNLRKYQPGEAAGSRPNASETFNISEDGHDFLFPLGASTLSNNPNLKQNPGY